MRITPTDCFAIFVDCQERLLPAMDGADALLQNIITLAKGLRIHEVPILVPQQYSKGLGETVAPLREVLGNFTPFEKTDFSAYSNELAMAANSLNRRVAIVCGIEAHVCVLQTVTDLRQAGYQVFLVQDCIGSRKPSDKDTAILRTVAEGAFITSYESLLFELTAGKNHPQFKAISDLVK